MWKFSSRGRKTSEPQSCHDDEEHTGVRECYSHKINVCLTFEPTRKYAQSGSLLNFWQFWLCSLIMGSHKWSLWVYLVACGVNGWLSKGEMKILVADQKCFFLPKDWNTENGQTKKIILFPQHPTSSKNKQKYTVWQYIHTARPHTRHAWP